MATVRRSDLIIPEVFTPYLIEATTQTDSFLQSGVVQPLAELNLSAEHTSWGSGLTPDRTLPCLG